MLLAEKVDALNRIAVIDLSSGALFRIDFAVEVCVAPPPPP